MSHGLFTTISALLPRSAESAVYVPKRDPQDFMMVRISIVRDGLGGFTIAHTVSQHGNPLRENSVHLRADETIDWGEGPEDRAFLDELSAEALKLKDELHGTGGTIESPR